MAKFLSLCTICKNSFINLTSLKAHENTHIGVGVLRVITRPEFDPTRSKEGKMPDPYPTRNFDKSI